MTLMTEHINDVHVISIQCGETFHLHHDSCLILQFAFKDT